MGRGFSIGVTRLTRGMALLGVVLFGLLGCAQPSQQPHSAQPRQPTSTQEPVSERSQAQQHKVFLWRTTSDTATVYLLGSIHAAPADLYPLDHRIEDAFSQSEYLVLEVDLEDEGAVDAIARFVEAALLPPGQTAYDNLDPELAERLRQRLTSLGLDPDRLGAFKLGFLTMQLAAAELQAAGYSGEHGIDAYFRRRAGTRTVLELETIEMQMQLLLNMSEQAQDQDVRMALDYDAVAFVEATFEEWKRGEVKGTLAMLEEWKSEYPAAFEAVYLQRNRGMTDKVRDYLAKSGTYFVVVGAGHLVGEGSVVDLLRRQGLTVTQQ